jgi:hypothetical protein
MNRPLKVGLIFAALGYLVAIGLYLAPLGWHLRPNFVLGICPPAFFTMVSMTDPSLTTMALILAPLNALLYGIVGLLIGLAANGLDAWKTSSGSS